MSIVIGSPTNAFVGDRGHVVHNDSGGNEVARLSETLDQGLRELS